MHFFSPQKVGRRCPGHVRVCISVSLEPGGADECVLFPQRCLDCQSHLSDPSPYERQAGFTLSPSTFPCYGCMCWCVYVLTCVNVCFCVTMSGGTGRVGGPCPIYNNCQLSVTNTSSVLLPVKGRWGTLRVFPPASNRGSDHLSFIGSVLWRTILSLGDAEFHLQSSLGQGNRSNVFPLQR